LKDWRNRVASFGLRKLLAAGEIRERLPRRQEGIRRKKYIVTSDNTRNVYFERDSLSYSSCGLI
jgi:hypothetical protein